MKESFDTSTDAITHDSGQRLLEFQLMSQDPNDLIGEGVLSDPIGTTVNLANANVVGASGTPVTGPRWGDITGGTGNYIFMELESPPVTLGSLTAGTAVISLEFTDPLPPPWGPPDTGIREIDINVTFADIVALATAQGFAGQSSALLDISSLVPHGMPSGLEIKNTQWTAGLQWVSPFGNVNSNSTVTVSTLTGGDVNTILIPTTLIGSDGFEHSISVFPEELAPLLLLIDLLPTYLFTTWDISAPELVLGMTPAQKASQDLYADPLHIFVGSFAPYDGYKIVAADVVNGGGDYHCIPEIDVPLIGSGSNLTLLLNRNGLGDLRYIGVVNPLLPVHTSYGGGGGLVGAFITANTFIEIHGYLMPFDYSSYPPLLWTVPMELRHRNRWAFKPYFDPATIPGDFTGQLAISTFVSQGPDQFGRWEWTPVAVASLPTAFGPPPTMIPVSSITNLPPNYSEGMIITSNFEYMGAYNYIKLLIEPSGEVDFSGITMQILANAREL